MMPMNPFRIVLADDHALLRQDLKRTIDEKPDMEVVGEAGDGLELLRLLDQLKVNQLAPHLVILDLSMPILLGMEALHLIKRTYPDLKVLILTMHKDREFACQAMAIGAKGYLLKEDAGTELFSAIATIRQGGIYVSEHLS